MKKLFTILAAIAVAAVLSIDADAKRFGVKAGVNVTDLNTENIDAISAMGYQAGLSWQFDLPLGFAIQPDLLYQVHATKFDQVGSQLEQGYIKVPVNVQWGLRLAHRKVRVFGQASPYASYTVKMDVPEGYSALDDVERLTYGAGLGAGVQLGFLQLTAQYNWAFGNDVEGKDFDTLFNKSNFNGYTVSLALMFGGKRK